VTGIAGALSVGLCFALIPFYGMMGAAVATIASYAVMFAGMAWWSQRVYPVPYQWRRVGTAAAVAVALVTVGKLADTGLVVSALLALAYPVALVPFAFYLPAERSRLKALVARS
jgi:O-antigen/teichoic acid export membrane protein